MKKNYFNKPFSYIAVLVATIAIFSLAILLLWNWLMPIIFGLTTINYLQAVGLLILIRLLFGTFKNPVMRTHLAPDHHRNSIFDKWSKMSDEERKNFIKKRKEQWDAMNDEERQAFKERRRTTHPHHFDKPDVFEK